MRKETKQLLDDQMSLNHWLLKIILISAFLTVCFLIYWLIDPGSAKTSQVVGFSINKTAKLHDEGHTNILFMKIANESRTIKIGLPYSVPAKINAKVLMSKIEKPSWTQPRYRFLKYVD